MIALKPSFRDQQEVRILTEKMKKHRVFVCDGEADEVEINQALEWVSEDPENRTATVQTSRVTEAST